MKLYYITIDSFFVKIITIDKEGFSFIPSFDKEDAGIFQLNKCEALRNDLSEKSTRINN